MPLIDLTGKKFGKLAVLKRVGTDKRRNPLWLCACDCGKQKIVRGNNLKSGNTSSCGCVHSKRIGKLNFKTGQYKSRLYSIWLGMKTRCYNPNISEFYRYGGRGIKVCDEWKNDFKAFYDWSMANGYDDSSTIDRIDNNGNYEPSNCRWANLHEQNRNRRSNRFFTFNGKTQCMIDWARELGIKPITLIARFRYGWSVERALTEEVKTK